MSRRERTIRCEPFLERHHIAVPVAFLVAGVVTNVAMLAMSAGPAYVSTVACLGAAIFFYVSWRPTGWGRRRLAARRSALSHATSLPPPC